MNLQDKSVEYFYNWESLGRGTVLFEEPVLLEPIYFRYSHTEASEATFIDDGRVPTLFERIYNHTKKLLSSPEDERVEEPSYSDDHFDVDEIPLSGFRISFQQGYYGISPNVCVEFINALSYTQRHLSFEILATHHSISIQIVGTQDDVLKAQHHCKGFFPLVNIEPIEDTLDLPFHYDERNEVAVVELAPDEEYMRPLCEAHDFRLDPLTSVLTTCEHLRPEEVVMLQILFTGVTNVWKHDILNSVSDGRGGSFFPSNPEMKSGAEQKVASPLFSCIIRLASQSSQQERSKALVHELAHYVTGATESPLNKLVLLSNEGYEYNQHVTNLFLRKSNRWGFFMNSSELAVLVHYPNNLSLSKLGSTHSKSKELPPQCINGRYTLGLNVHQGQERAIMLTDEMRLRHTHIIGATGVGKSTLIAHLMSEDMKAGNGCALFDPHGDIIEDVIAQIPPDRLTDVILIDPSDTDFPMGFNLLHAPTEEQKIVLSSDLVSAFASHATAWGDQMTSVLSNAINAFLYSSRGGTLLELKRFLLERSFRNSILQTVDDPSTVYYFEHEFPMLRRNSLSPLLTRIDTFLRPAIIRNMMAQKSGIDFTEVLQNKSILLVRLSIGLIGHENSTLLASLFLAKLLQSAQARQAIPQSQRHPYYIYLDECQHFMSPSISQILQGARKYSVGLTMSHQEMAQINSPEIASSILSNPYTRICFRVGDIDARKLEHSFSYFDSSDLQRLSIGQAIVSVGGSSNDCTLSCSPPSKNNNNEVQHLRDEIVRQTRERYATPKEDIEVIISDLLPKTLSAGPITKTDSPSKNQSQNTSTHQEISSETSTDGSTSSSRVEAESDFETVIQKREEAREHQKIQRDIKKTGQAMGFLSTIEKGIEGAQRIDVMLERSDVTIAIEVSVTNTVGYEIQNIRKCLSQASYIVLTSPSDQHLKEIQDQAQKVFDSKANKRLHFCTPDGISSFLSSFNPPEPKKHERIVHGYRVKTTESNTDPKTLMNKMDELVKILGRKKM